MAAAVLHHAILDSLGRQITSGEIPAGAVLTLERLQGEHGVSRTVMREVMRMLEGVRLVQPRRRVGLVVLSAHEWSVYDARVIRWRLDGPDRPAQLRSLTELRIAVEPLATAGAARYADDATRTELLDAAGQMRALGEAGRLEEFLDVDAQFHAMLLRASRNEMFAALTDVVAEVLAGRTHHGLMPTRPQPEALDLHEEVARAVSVGDADAAEAAMGALVGEVRAALG